MEDFGLFRGSKSLDYSGTWEDTDCISEAKMAKLFSDQGLRYRMSKTEEEESQHEPLFGVGPRVANIWEALGFTATSNNEARQQEKLKAIEKCRTTTKGVMGGAGGVRFVLHILKSMVILVYQELVVFFTLTNYQLIKFLCVVSTWVKEVSCGLYLKMSRQSIMEGMWVLRLIIYQRRRNHKLIYYSCWY